MSVRASRSTGSSRRASSALRSCGRGEATAGAELSAVSGLSAGGGGPATARRSVTTRLSAGGGGGGVRLLVLRRAFALEIGRASCRGRVKARGVGGWVEVEVRGQGDTVESS